VNLTTTGQEKLNNVSVTYYNRERGLYANTMQYGMPYWERWMWDNVFQLFTPSIEGFGSYWAQASVEEQGHFMNLTTTFMELMSLQITLEEADARFDELLQSAHIASIQLISWYDVRMEVKINAVLEWSYTRWTKIKVEVVCLSSTWPGNYFTCFYNQFDFNDARNFITEDLTTKYSNQIKGTGVWPFWPSSGITTDSMVIDGTEINTMLYYDANKVYTIRAYIEYSELWTTYKSSIATYNIPKGSMRDNDPDPPVVQGLEMKYSDTPDLASSWYPIGEESNLPIMAGKGFDFRYKVYDKSGIATSENPVSKATAYFSPSGRTVDYTVTSIKISSDPNDYLYYVKGSIPASSLTSEQEVQLRLYVRDADDSFPTGVWDMGKYFYYIDWLATTTPFRLVGKRYTSVSIPLKADILEWPGNPGDYLYPNEYAGFNVYIYNPLSQGITVTTLNYALIDSRDPEPLTYSLSITPTAAERDIDMNSMKAIQMAPNTDIQSRLLNILPGLADLKLWIQVRYNIGGSAQTPVVISKTVDVNPPEQPTVLFDNNGLWEPIDLISNYIHIWYRDRDIGEVSPGQFEVRIKTINNARAPLTVSGLVPHLVTTQGKDSSSPQKIETVDNNNYLRDGQQIAGRSSNIGSFTLRMKDAIILHEDNTFWGIFQGADGWVKDLLEWLGTAITRKLAEQTACGFMGGVLIGFAAWDTISTILSLFNNVDFANCYSLTFSNLRYSFASGRYGDGGGVDFVGKAFTVFASSTPLQWANLYAWAVTLFASYGFAIAAGIVFLVAAFTADPTSRASLTTTALILWVISQALKWTAEILFWTMNRIDPAASYETRVSRDYPTFDYPYNSTGDATQDEKAIANYRNTAEFEYDTWAVDETINRMNAAAASGDSYWETMHKEDYLFFIKRREEHSQAMLVDAPITSIEDAASVLESNGASNDDLENAVGDYVSQGGLTPEQDAYADSVGIPQEVQDETLTTMENWENNGLTYNYTTIDKTSENLEDANLEVRISDIKKDHTLADDYINDILDYRYTHGQPQGSITAADEASLNAKKSEIETLLVNQDYNEAILQSNVLMNMIIDIQLLRNVQQDPILDSYNDYAFFVMDIAYRQTKVYRSSGLVIDGNAQLAALSESGDGTADYPYMIGNLYIAPIEDNETCIVVKNTDAFFIIANCAFKNHYVFFTGDCIRLQNIQHATILGNIFFGNPATSIWVQPGCSDITIESNTFYGFQVLAISIQGSNCLIKNNVVYNRYNAGGGGLYLIGATNCRLFGNKFYFCGIGLAGTEEAHYTSHVIDATNLLNRYPILCLNEYTNDQVQAVLAAFPHIGVLALVKCDNIVLDNVNMGTPAVGGIALIYSSNVVVRNTIFGGSLFLINSIGCIAENNQFRYVSTAIIGQGGNIANRNTIRNNQIADVDTGIEVNKAVGFDIIGNTIERANNYGIIVVNSNDSTFVSNTIQNSLFVGIDLYGLSSRNLILDNTISNCEYGIYADQAGSNTYRDNTFSSLTVGIYLYQGGPSLIEKNRIIDCSLSISIEATGNLIIANVISNSGSNAAYSAPGNAWNNGTAGNYWSDYQQRYPAAHVKGWTLRFIYEEWDTPYEVIPGIIDYHPLVTLTPATQLVLNGNTQIDAFFAGNSGHDGLSWSTAYILEAKAFIIAGGLNGIAITNSQRFIVIKHCTIWAASANSYMNSGIRIDSSSNLKIQDCSVFNANSAMMLTATGTAGLVEIRDCFMLNSVRTGTGITAVMTTNLNVVNNYISTFQDAVYLYRGGSQTYSGNVIINCGRGIVDLYCDNVFDSNYFYTTDLAISLVNSHNDTISGNFFYNDGIAVVVENTVESIIDNNTFAECLDYAVIVTVGSTGNAITSNTFFRNNGDNVQAYDDGSDNMWSNNYWSDYIDAAPSWGAPYLIDGSAGASDSNPDKFITNDPFSELFSIIDGHLVSLGALINSLANPGRKNACLGHLEKCLTYYMTVKSVFEQTGVIDYKTLDNLLGKISVINRVAKEPAITSECNIISNLVNGLKGAAIDAELEEIAALVDVLVAQIAEQLHGCQQRRCLEHANNAATLVAQMIEGRASEILPSCESISTFSADISWIEKTARNDVVDGTCATIEDHIDTLKAFTCKVQM